MPPVKKLDEELIFKKKQEQEQQQAQEEKPFNFEYNNRTFESYNKYQLPIPQNLVNQDQETIFLSAVDPEKMHEIERKITKIIRVKKPDLLSKGKHTVKEFMVVFENWYGKDWRGEEVAPCTDHIEGVYYEQDIKPAPFVNGRPTGQYKRTGQHEVHYLEWNKESFDEIIDRSASDKDDIILHIEVGSADRRAPKFAKTFSYDQFKELSFDELLKLTT